MIGDSEMQISLAKPPTENKQKEKRKQMHKMQFMHGSVTVIHVNSLIPPHASRFLATYGAIERVVLASFDTEIRVYVLSL